VTQAIYEEEKTTMPDILTGTPYGLDSFVLCIGLAAAVRNWRVWLLQSTMFGLADGTAGCLGQALAEHLSALPHAMTMTGPLLVAGYGVLVLIASNRLGRVLASCRAMIAFPILLSVDNLIAGAYLMDVNNFGIVQALKMGGATAAMAFGGCCLGGLLIGRWSIPRYPLVGGTALTAAVVMLVG
jgi:hypothetical protein